LKIPDSQILDFERFHDFHAMPLAPPRCRWPALFATLLLLLGAGPALLAHDIFSSWTDVQVHADRLEAKLTLARASALRIIANGRALPPITPETFAGHEPALLAAAPQLFGISLAGQPLTLTAARAEVSGDEDVAYHLTYPLPSDARGTLRFFAGYLFHLVDRHVGTLVIMTPGGRDLGWTPINVDQPYFEVPLPGAAGGDPAAVVTPPFRTFLVLGIEHILIGYDHLLFLLGLLIACQRFRTMVGIVTCFTIAHSITLGLAAFDVFNLPPSVVEPLIAASIVFVGVENLLYRGREPRHRWVLTFGFGLVHGFGFAGILKQVGHGLSGSSLAMPLFSFNLGVEIGQIAVAAIGLPLLLWGRKQEKLALYGPPLVSSLVALAGMVWLVQRTVFS
jgi:hydrogenase/urease accessory protein HupE